VKEAEKAVLDPIPIIIDWHRVQKFVVLGMFYIGPVLHGWYGFLMRFWRKNDLLTTLKRTAADQFLFAPTFLSGFFINASLLDGKDLNFAREKLERDLLSTVVANWSVWIPSMLIW
jgi:hypothetical protein